LDVLKAEGFIRGYAEVEMKGKPSEVRDRAEISRGPAGDPRVDAHLDARTARL
jgi:hypothetical protein